RAAGDHNVIVGEGGRVGIAWSTGSNTNFRRFDEAGMPSSVQAGVAPAAPLRVAVSSHMDFATIVWGVNTKLHARVLTDMDVWGADAFEVQAAAFTGYLFLQTAAGDTGDTAIVWSGSAALGVNE